VDVRYTALVEELNEGRIDRRTFMVRAIALGATIPAIAAALNLRGVSAQDSTPAAGGGPATAAEIGVQGVEHITDTSAGVIKFVSSWPMTGASEQIGGDSAEAIRMALEDFGNAAGGFALEYEALDDGIAANQGGWDAGKEAENANLVVNDPDVMVYIATYNSGAAKISIPILNQAVPPLAMISPANTTPGLTKAVEGITEEGEPEIYYPSGFRNYMRVTASDDLQGFSSANWAYNELGARSAYILHDRQVYGQGVAQAFRLAFEELGGEILGFDGYDADSEDYQSLMTGIADTAPDMLYLGAIVNQNASKLLSDMRSLMSADDTAFMGPDGLINTAFIEGAGDAAEGAYITFGGLPPASLDTAAGQDWYTRIRERLGRDPDAYAVYAYEAAVVAIQAIDKVQVKDRQAILDAMISTEGFVGLLGEWSFDANGDKDNQIMGLNQIENGAIKFLKTITPA
jgi:branched-chain amino acid transport system substrate-binding protein